ncbi:hypothetical protein EZJ43_15850 [Pedobacter changchengzhani]|uniref:Uncharacterized protein n=1 Tax=Pedobacter changchengzhani TaxID=2529274 RepID=A0A4R5MHL7_9SPHI|nr:hypothetical protein [Pedobacter changchengzhani]TDG35040.1 hypothetical protein EZJ43_15850 [Pedobacter changchengzhani]
MGYTKDSLLYGKLKISFYSDSTFKLNFDVPFLFGSSGKWLAGGRDVEDWNRMYYKSWKFPDEDYQGNQFSGVWTQDSIFYINGATPKDNQDFIQEIYFKKIKQPF